MDHAVKSLFKKCHAINRMEQNKKRLEFQIGFKSTFINKSKTFEKNTNNKSSTKNIATEILPYNNFYPAEEYHQEFFKRNPHQGYCMAVVSPKLSKFRKNFTAKLKK